MKVITDFVKSRDTFMRSVNVDVRRSSFITILEDSINPRGILSRNISMGGSIQFVLNENEKRLIKFSIT